MVSVLTVIRSKVSYFSVICHRTLGGGFSYTIFLSVADALFFLRLIAFLIDSTHFFIAFPFTVSRKLSRMFKSS